MTTSLIQIATPDGSCTAELVVPTGTGPWPVVVVFFDAAGLRPAQTRIAERIAGSGYLVVQPDLFHRSAPLATLLGGPPTLAGMMKVFGAPDQARQVLAPSTTCRRSITGTSRRRSALCSTTSRRPRT